jgi:hypothetical protein
MNPFLGMMTLMGATADCAAPDSGDAESGNPIPDMDPEMKAGDMNPMQLMQKAFLLQMQLNQTMFMMPFAMMQSLGKMVNTGAGSAGESATNQSGFKLGGVEIPPELLQMLLQIDMKPENLEKLQKALDFLFSAIPEAKEEEADGSGSDGQQ